MRSRERVFWVIACGALAVLAWSGRAARPMGAPPVARPRSEPGPRVTMAALHQQGGVPLGWQLRVPPGNVDAGRASFDALGCAACHRVAGETFKSAVPQPVGPELTGMGSHHPAAYFAEAVLDPDAVLIDEPGYIGDDGHSIMPTYADVTIGQLSDLVAYLGSLRDGGSPSCHGSAAAGPGAGLEITTVSLRDRPLPPSPAAHAFFAQDYDLLPGQVEGFEEWFGAHGRAGFLDAEGLVSLDTFVDASRASHALTTVFGFRDEAALRTFLGDPAMADLWQQFDAFVGPHGHIAADQPLVYRVPALSGN